MCQKSPIFMILAIALTINCINHVEADFLNKLQKSAEDTAKSVSNICIINDNCYKEFLTVNNYCCLRKAQCCNMFDYVFSGG